MARRIVTLGELHALGTLGVAQLGSIGGNGAQRRNRWED